VPGRLTDAQADIIKEGRFRDGCSVLGQKRGGRAADRNRPRHGIPIGMCLRPAAAHPLANVDLARMVGNWHIVATIPNFLERGIVGGLDVLKPDGLVIHEDLYIQRGGFDARKQHLQAKIFVLPHSGNADWRVQPFWPLRLPFQIYYVDPEYRYALFGQQNRNWGWVYSCTADIPEADFQALLGRFRSLGYDTGRFRKMVQTPDQIGAPGYGSEVIKVPTKAVSKPDKE
jgi:apolipoprotein D and lipocalin family protein